MADKTHLQILRSGAHKWNKWRSINPDSRPLLVGADLNEAYLTAADLSGAILDGADLSRAILDGADLSSARLIGANLSSADLNEANLTDANLNEANLTDAYLNDADLSSARLIGANLNGANLSGADFSSARLGETVIAITDLSDTKGLESCIHHYQSIVDFHTLRESWPLPLPFLRGIGLPNEYIEQLPALIGSLSPIQFYSVFISYSSKDERFARRLYNDLQGDGIRCWFAPEDLKIGERFRRKIDEAIRIYDRLLLVLSKTSVESDWVEVEVEAAIRKEKATKDKPRTDVLFPIAIDKASFDSTNPLIEHIRGTRHIGNFVGWKTNDDKYQEAYKYMVSCLRSSSE